MRVTVVANVPPPLTGRSQVTGRMIEALGSRCAVRTFTWSGRGPSGSRSWRWMKALRGAVADLKLLASPRGSGQAVCYTVANSGAGLWLNALTLCVARARGYRCVLHHHSFLYLMRRDRRMRVLDHLLGPHGIHVVLCDEMDRVLRGVHRCVARTVVLPNAVLLEAPSPASPPDVPAAGVFRLGHLGNLSVDKGLEIVLETFSTLRERGRDVQLVLAGPLESNRERRLVEALSRAEPDRVEHLGPVHGRAKEEFFRRIDALLFPTLHRGEAQPLVIAEALARSKPVVAFARGCIPSQIAAGGLVIAPDESFAPRAADCVEGWMLDSAAYRATCSRARDSSEALRAIGATALDDLVRTLDHGAGDSRARA